MFYWRWTYTKFGVLVFHWNKKYTIRGGGWWRFFSHARVSRSWKRHCSTKNKDVDNTSSFPLLERFFKFTSSRNILNPNNFPEVASSTQPFSFAKPDPGSLRVDLSTSGLPANVFKNNKASTGFCTLNSPDLNFKGPRAHSESTHNSSSWTLV